ncbi:MAG: right-handed parallel beta-helix repeat-containing protein [Candidatus Cloacimonetes bacterium]|nr:right-handed parallel beta-helix repeat-containing protein [Candidatus Cloacimonadota bacterium]
MEKISLLILILFVTILPLYSERIAAIEGYCFLDGETNHEGVKVLLTALSPSATTDSTYTNDDGYYMIEISEGIYDIEYSKQGWESSIIEEMMIFEGLTIDDITLINGIPLEIIGSVQGTWTDNYIYEVIGNITINEGDSLFIEPGVEVRFMGNYSLFVYGTLISDGTADEMITFTSGQEIKQPGDWEKIEFENYNENGSIIRYSIVEYSHLGIKCDNNEINIINYNIIRGNEYSGIYCNYSSPEIISNTIYNNNYGIYASGSESNVRDNDVFNNQVGILNINTNNVIQKNNIYGNIEGINVTESSPIIRFNTIINSEEYGINYHDSDNAIFENNIFSNNNIGIQYDSNSLELEYNCFWMNNEDVCGSNIPSYFGIIITVNNNNDPCDTYYNIFFNPLFINTLNNDYRLSTISPCIDAGNPDPQYNDPDGTISDIGANYFDINGLFADFIADPVTGQAPLTVYFENISNGDVDNFYWDMNGDGVTDTSEENPVWIYMENGFYTVSLTIQNFNGESNTRTRVNYINVRDPEIIELSGNLSGVLESGYIYNVIGDINIYVNDTLEIEPGVEIQFMGNYTFDIDGVLNAIGTENDSIKFTSGNAVKNPGDWDNIYFSGNSSSNSEIMYTCIEFANKGIYCDDSSPTISNNRISNNNNYGVYCRDSSPTINNNTISNNGSGYSIDSGISCYSSSPTINNNIIINNNVQGILCTNSSSPTISNNTITNNQENGIYCLYTSPSISNNTINNNQENGIISSNSSSIISNNTITNNQENGILCSNSSPTISNNTITNNQSGGIRCGYSSPTISNNTISNNNNSGILCFSSSPTISNNTISNNQNCGINCNDSSPSISNNTISNNDDNGIDCKWDSSPTISNNTISNNNNSGIDCQSSSPTISNNTIDNNQNCGIYCWYSSYPDILNNIIYDNVTGIQADSSPSSLDYNLFWLNDNAGSGDNIPSTFGEIVTVNANGDPCDTYLNLFMEPCFVDSANGDYHLTEDSPCIDAGDPTSILDPDGTIADMGALYFDQSLSEHIYGDVDDNGEVESFDSSLVLQYFCLLVPEGTTLPWEDWRFEVADVDGNGVVEAYDASLILRFSVGFIDEFPVENLGRK